MNFGLQLQVPLVRLLVIVTLLLGVVGPVSAQDGEGDGATGGACGDPATPIHELQGSGERTPIGGEKVTVEAVVIGDYQSRDELQGFFLQEEDADSDDDPGTSEGVFVDSRLIREDVQVGDVVRLTGTVFDVSDSGQWRTQLSRIDTESFAVCDSGATVTPLEVILPLASASNWEQYEGMLVTFLDELTVTQLYNLGRYGEIELAAGGRLFQPTNMARPGEAADTIADENARRSFILDDGNSQQNLDPTRYPDGGLSTGNRVRSGYVVTGVTGVFDQRFGTYRVYAREVPNFTPENERPEPPELGGRLTVASFNVLNYFNGDGAGGGFPTERGANTAEEFARQQEKIVAALAALEADVIGLMEIENDGDGPESAVAALVHALNVAVGDDRYAYINDPAGLNQRDAGGDAIKQAIIYNSFSVQPVGDPVTTLDPPFEARRPAVVQAFEEIETGEVFTVSVNHFKSKGCPGPGDNADQGDGQGCWNAERVQAAQTLSAWLASDPTGTGDPDILVIGDLNAYTMEDPLIAFEDAGYENLVLEYEGEENYSYVYFGMAGSLDHALASPSLAEQVVGTQTWHINADEPRVFDYNVEYKSDNHVVALFEPGPYRSSDHDPVVVGLDLASEGEVSPPAQATEEVTEEPTTEPTSAPTEAPTVEPTEEPTEEPTAEPTEEPTLEPTEAPTEAPTEEPTAAPTEAPVVDEGGDDDLSDSTGGLIAIIGGAVALLLAIVATFVGRMRQRR